MRRRGRYEQVEASFLELAEPTIEDAGRRCAEQGADRVILHAGGGAKYVGDGRIQEILNPFHRV